MVDDLADPAVLAPLARRASPRKDRRSTAMGLDVALGAMDRVLLTAAPGLGVDFVDKGVRRVPWLIAAFLIITYFVLLRAFRS
jgi:hypothetical protein